MLCPFCDQSESKVIDSRESPDGVRRRRECLECNLRYTTYERVHNLPLTIVKRDGRRESFSAQKLERSLRTACAKRPLEIAALSKIVVDVESALHRSGKAEIDSRMVGEMVIEQLRQIDRVAYIRFASVYRDFQDITTFAREIEALADDKAVETNGINQLLLIPDDAAQLPARRPGGSGHSAQPHPGSGKTNIKSPLI